MGSNKIKFGLVRAYKQHNGYYQKPASETNTRPINSQLSTVALCAAILFCVGSGHLLIHDLILTTARHRPSRKSTRGSFAAASLGRILPWLSRRNWGDFTTAPPQGFNVGNGGSTDAACASMTGRRDRGTSRTSRTAGSSCASNPRTNARSIS
jgi:hypothetical protein